MALFTRMACETSDITARFLRLLIFCFNNFKKLIDALK
ncbi:hypothetical protein BN136_2870 [Cronobacter universalis NCTC 9529]|nr:hypothetical protein BN136_2870 [Cronobacter universalis NCTC 9529]